MSMKHDDVAVIGMSGRFPGANSVAEFWENICAGRDSIRSLSDCELRSAGVSEADIDSSSYVKAAAVLDDVDRFDAGFFKISPLEAELMDPQLRLLLQCAWEALEDAGRATKDAQNIGVFAGGGGVPTSYFANFVNVSSRLEKVTASPTHLGNDKDFLATYLSYKLNLTGPSVTVQTACSTSAVALHQARLSLLSGECDMALAGGVSVRVPHGHGYHSKEGYIFSRSGRIRTFDEGADGVVFGSGLGLVLIKTLAAAIRDGDNIYAIIKGSAISNDGRGKMSYAASSAKGQMACIRSALKSAAVDASTIGFVEAHGTGTAMGDPEEVKALSGAFKEQTQRKGYCALGAVKTNVGHLEAAAGIAGFIKAVLAVRNGVIPPTAHFNKPNSRIKFERTPFYVNSALQPWNETGRPRRAALNSLGVGGTNAFVVLEEYVPEQKVVRQPVTWVVVPLSAKTEASLAGYVKRLLEYLDAAEEPQRTIDIADLAYTLQVGREAMDCRIAFTVTSITELKACLTRYLQSDATISTQGGDAELAARWVKNADVDWDKIYAGEKPRRISLPTYVFASDKYWLATPQASPSTAVLHPLLHVNTSDLSEQRFSSTFTGDEFFLKDHLLRTGQGAPSGAPPQKILPGVAYLEMARAAIEMAAPARPESAILELRDVVWVRPVVVATQTQVSIALLEKNQRIGFEVYSEDARIHCQGQGTFSSEAAPAPLDLARIKDNTRIDLWTAESVYSTFGRMGLEYGPSHQAIAALRRGEEHVLAELRLPASLQAALPRDSLRAALPFERVPSGQQDLLLHPSLMDAGLQACIGLLVDPHNVPGRPWVPFALDLLRIVSPCAAEMYAWVRYSQGCEPHSATPKLDIDLCDLQGNVCVQMRGYAPRAFGKETMETLLATATWKRSAVESGSAAPAERHIIVCDLPHVRAAELDPHCSHLALDAQSNIAERYQHFALTCFEKVQALIAGKPKDDVLLQIVLPGEDESIFAGLSGFFKTAQLENPHVRGQVIFTQNDIDTAALGELLRAEQRQSQDTLVKYEGGIRHTSRWQVLPDAGPGPFDNGEAFNDSGVYLITGGLGGLGSLFAREILSRAPKASIVLTGRSTWAEVKNAADKKAILKSLQAGGGKVEYRQLHLQDPEHVRKVVAAVHKKHKQLNGVIHSAGMTADSFILKKTAADFRRVLGPKVLGTFHLDQATQGIDLDFMVLFSSLTSAVGNLGQADYATANGFMDEFARWRNRLVSTGERRGTTLAIRWPLWQAGGMQLDESGRKMLHESTGIRSMHTQTGLRSFYRSLASRCDQTLVMEGDLEKIQRILRVGPATAAESASQPAADAGAVSGTAANLADLTQEFLRKQLCTLLKLPLHKVDSVAPLENYGMNSILALDFARQLEQTFGALPKTLLFEYLSIRDLAGYFLEAHAAKLNSVLLTDEADGSKSPSASASVQPPAQARPESGTVASYRFGRRRCFDENSQGASASRTSEPIAIIGLSGRYPEARDLEAFWRNLRDGKDCIVEIPEERWNWRDYYDASRTERGRHFSKWGGFIEGVDEFDARFFNISPVEAELLDPQERLFLQHAWMAMEDAGYTRASLQIPDERQLPGQVGVYAGVMYGEYQLFGAEESLRRNHMGFASNLANIANRVSYVLNLHGPSMAVDTMCSSSLTAIHLACQDLKLGRTALAIAGGVNVTIHPNKYLMLSAGQFISGDGHCQSFGEGGDGYIPGEGVGVLILKRLSEAERDGNHIYGVIRGSALSHGGKTNGYTVPNPQAQAGAIRQAIAEARIDPRHISYIEAHGTGTKLGDPIEIAALSKVFQESTRQTQFCRIGSAKSNIGHCEAAAGIAGLTKVLLQMKHGQIVPSLHSSRLNPHIDFEKTPFVVNQTLRAWQQPVIDGSQLPRIAGVSSFGAGGSNAHLLVEEYRPSIPAARVTDPVAHIVPLSARTPEQLRQKAQELLGYLRDAAPVALPAIAYTLQIGREAMDERLGILVSSVAALAEKLQAHLDGGESIAGIHQGQVKANREALALWTQDADLRATVEKWVLERKLAQLADLWAKGLELDWDKFHPVRPGFISLPTYPFARQKYWFDTAAGARPSAKSVSAAILHPLLHINTSDFSQQSYSSEFSGSEPFLAGTPGKKCLTTAACLEMARAAIEKARPARREGGVLSLRNVVWAEPDVSVEKRRVTIALFDNQDEQLKFEIYSHEAGANEATEQTVHCQGLAAFDDQPSPATLDIARLKSQTEQEMLDGQLLAQLRLAAELETDQNTYVLHPVLMDSVLRAALGLTDGYPVAVESLRILFPCTSGMFAWVRRSSSSDAPECRAVDIDLCDEQGNVCAQMRAIQYRQVEIQTTAPAPIHETFLSPPVKIAFGASESLTSERSNLKEKNTISLTMPGELTALDVARSPLRKARLSLPNAATPSNVQEDRAAASAVSLFDHGNGIFSIQVTAPETRNALTTGVIRQWLQALHRVREEPSTKVLMIRGVEDCFLTGGRNEHNEAIESGLYRALAEFPYPVIAVMRGDAAGAGFLVGSLCDFMICSESGTYAITQPRHGLYPSCMQELCNRRFGRARAADFLYLSASLSGQQLKKKGWTCPILPADQVESHAHDLAASLAKQSQQALGLLKTHLNRYMLRLANALTTALPEESSARPDAERSNIFEREIHSPSTRIQLDTHAERTLVIRILAHEDRQNASELLNDLEQIFGQLNPAARYRSIVLASEHAGFVPEGTSGEVARRLGSLIVSSALPVVAALNANATGTAWLISQLCDACVYSETGRYSCAGILRTPALEPQAAVVFSHRFGAELAKQLLLSGDDYSGNDLQGALGTVHVAKPEQVVANALKLAEHLGAFPPEVIAAWKREIAATIQSASAEPDEATGLDCDESDFNTESIRVHEGTPIVLDSKVITATAHPEGVLVVRMADREAKNMFSENFSRGMSEVFAHVESSAAYKVVLITGYDNYFSSGGTPDMLLAIHAGRAKFTDNKVFQLPLTCRVPVIAAMQGHGIGAGWAMGMFADFTLFSEAGQYVSPYMSYGFTPGAGSTLIFPDKMGHDLAWETLLTAREYSGGALKARGLANPVLPREQVVPAAMTLAKKIARQSRSQLVALKSRWTQALHERLQETFDLELAMHERTFVGQADTLERIQSSFARAPDRRLPAVDAAVDSFRAVASASAVSDLAGVTAHLKKLLADELRMPEQQIDPDEKFVDLGLDSITGVTWIRRINEKYKTAIEAIKVYSYPTLNLLASYVAEQAKQSGTLSPAPVPAPRTEQSAAATSRVMALVSWRNSSGAKRPAGTLAMGSVQPIAVVGMAGQFPGARNLEEFWRNIAQGKDCIGEVPKQRWDIDRYYHAGEPVAGKTNSRWMGALDDYDRFDPAFFHISPREARSMDPQQRLFLQACWHSIENAGYDPRSLSGSRCGVFVGCSAGDYHQLSELERLSGQGFTGAAPSILAARISYLLNLHGPSVAIDTACSSSLVAIANACDSLICGNSDVALAGGVNVMCGPAMHIMTSQLGMLSPDGRCFTFDQRANGVAVGEGVGVVMLKRLSDAQRDQDFIYGVVRGWGVNQDGKTNGITAPNADSQTRLQQEVYDKFRIDPAGIQLIEAHGTGTALGDPLEVAALQAAFAKYTQEKDYCALGSVKSNIGHCLTAAGVSGFIKILLALQHQQLPPTLHFNRLNPHISLQGTQFFINTELRPWRDNAAQPRQAAINSFGFSGTNAHVVIAEYRPEEEVSFGRGAPSWSAPLQNEATLVPLSARTADQLRQKARDLLDFIRAQNPQASLQSVAYTLQAGREAMNERLAFVVSSLDELATQLESLVGEGAAGAHVYQGQVSDSKDTLLSLTSDPDFHELIIRWHDQKNLPKLAGLWVKGLALDWSRLHAPGRLPQRIGLPTYPFAKERYWIDASPECAPPAVADGASAVPEWAGAPRRSAGPAVAQEHLLRQLQASLAEALFMKPADVGLDTPFTALGLDSIVGVEWVRALNKEFGTTLSATRVYDFPTIRELASFLSQEMAASDRTPHEAAAPQVARVSQATTVASVAAVAQKTARESAISAQELQRQLTATLADALFMKPADIGINKSFTELGLDSIVGVEWVKTLNKRYGTTISAAKIYDHPTIKELTSFVLDAIAATASPSTEQGFRFEPKSGRGFSDLYFHGASRERDFEKDGELTLLYTIDPRNNVCLKEHVVFDEHLLPTDAYIELVYSACRTYFSAQSICLRNLIIVNPLLGTKDRSNYLKLTLRRQGAALQFFVRSSFSPDFANETLHMQGFIAAACTPQASEHPREARRFPVEKELAREQIPTNVGTYYAPLQKLLFGESAALGHIEVRDHEFKFLLNPFALYGGLCTVINYGAYLAGRQYGPSDDQFLPYRIDTIAVLGALDGGSYRCYAAVKRIERDSVELSFELLDLEDRPVLIVDSISLRRVGRKSIEQQVKAINGLPVSAVSMAPVVSVAGTPEKVAIIGMSCRYPESENVEAFWNNLKHGKDCVTEVPEDRWKDHPDWFHPDPHHPRTSYSKWGGFLASIDTFEPLFFGISPAEAQVMDPQQRIFLEECWKTIESAGYAPSALSHQACGVYVGCSTGDYSRVLTSGGQDTVGAAFMGTSNAILAARIAYHLNLKGPALAIDTACSSSLVAVHLACESIRNGENQLAVAGGVNVLATPLGHILTSQVGMPSKDGKCAAFDESANGIVFSEGCGVVLLKALSKALADGDNILGIIEASGINQDGRTNGITAPSSRAQEQLLKQTYQRFGIDARKISYVEAHGTATALGDPIEVNALSAVFLGSGADRHSCAIGSVKSNIGHTGFAAGIAGLIKILLSLQHSRLAPSIHFRKPNPHIDFEASPFFVNTEYRDWPSDEPRLAAVSSFGFSGTNAHVVIREFDSQVEIGAPGAFAPNEKFVVPLSAGTPEQLQRKASDLLSFIRAADASIDLARLAYTLQVGRDPMQQRLGFIVTSVEQLAEQLQGYIDGRTSGGNVYRGEVSRENETLAIIAADADMRKVIDQWIAQGHLSKILDLWVKGLDVDWSRCYGAVRPRRMRLPSYPFAKERHWVERSASHSTPAAGNALARLHPLVHINTSDLSRQSYSSSFSGEEFFLTDHCVNGQKVLPAVACLEMARAAAQAAMPAEQSSGYLELRHVVWAQPIVVAKDKHVTIALAAQTSDEVDFEISSLDGDGREVTHCQGQVVFADPPAFPRLDFEKLKGEMARGERAGAELYPIFEKMGLSYGPAFRGIAAIHQGTQQLLVELSLPAAARQHDHYTLHPSLMDSALQGSITLIADIMEASGRPSLPFALESLRIAAACPEEMIAWVRYSHGERVCSELLKVDIDLCDRDGNVCVQMRGFSSRAATSDAMYRRVDDTESFDSFEEARYRNVIENILSGDCSVDEAAELG